MDVWIMVHYRKMGCVLWVLILIDTIGNCAEDAVTKIQFLAKMAFPAPVAFLGVKGSLGW
jgi:hypothetical protein